MRTGSLLRLLWSVGLAGCLVGGCRCSRDVAVDEGPEIDKKPIIEEDPDAPRPQIVFPADVRLEDPTLNAFIERVLQICYAGDYDGFRQLFGTAYQPTTESDFRRVWHGVKRIEVMRIYMGPGKEPRYFVLAKVHLREPDNKGREERDIRVMVFKEGSDWRVGPPPQEAIERLRALESQPASGPATEPAP